MFVSDHLKSYRPLVKRAYKKKYFFYISTKTYVENYGLENIHKFTLKLSKSVS